MKNKPKYIIIHHSYMNDLKDGNSFNRIRDYHINVNKWSAIGYHYTVEYSNYTEPMIRWGRKEHEGGAHAIGFNSKSIGICVVGNYDRNVIEDDKYDALLILVRSLMQKYKIKKKNVLGHRETYKLRKKHIEKSCPGKKVDMGKLREDL